MTLTTAAGKVCEGIDQGPFEPIAIVGASALMPDAESMEQFWQNIIDAKVSIKEIDPARWGGDVNAWWKQGGPGNSTEGFTYAKIGAFVEGFEFDWKRWRQPPGTLPQIDPCQLWAISVAADVLDDAGYGIDGKELDKARCGVVFANALGGENRNLSNIRVWSEHTLNVAKKFGLPVANSEQFVAELVDGTPRINEDTMPGELANVVAGRVANLLDLQGPNHAMDAACASSLAAVMDACRLLQTRQVDSMICGATDRTMDPATFSKFSAIGALSPSHSTPFDAGANGFVMGEGAGALLLKRLSDAIADGDEIKAVIRGVGASSDGRGKGITAPSQRGQVQAIGRAYSQAGYDANSVQLVEAHGTSTKVGDATELSTLGRLWTDIEPGDRVAVGSIKSQIGHLKAAAGIAGILKASYALHHRTIPPSAGFVNPNPTVEWSENPFFVPTQAMEWPAPEGHPRRAGVSAFGFGGTNFHVALEGYDPEYHSSISEMWKQRWSAYSGQEDAGSVPDADSILDKSAIPVYSHEEMKGIEGGILLLSGESISEVKAKLESLSFSGTNFDDSPSGLRLSSELPKASKEYSAKDAVRMALVATSWSELEKRKALALKAMEDKAKWGFLMAQMVLLTDDTALPLQAKVAHMYPGQGSQYVGMTFDLWKRFSAVQQVWEAADETMVDVLDGETLSGFVLRDNLSKEEMVEASHKLKQTEYTQPAMLTADLAIEKSLNDHGLYPDMVAGHSLGEYAALMSSGIMDMDSALRAAAARGTEMGSVEIDDNGLMASVTAEYDEVAAVIESIDGYVIAANKNSPKMTVIAGSTPAVKEAMAKFEEKGFNCVVLPTSHAFHSEIVAPANAPLKKFLEGLELNFPKIPITSNVDGQFYPMKGESSNEAILEKLAPQMASSVEWTTQINTMYDAGARVFVEVGPKRALTVFATQILEGKPHLAVMANHPKQGGIATFLAAVASMALAGRDVKIPSFDSDVYTEGFRAGPLEAYEMSSGKEITTSALEDLRINARPLPSGSTGAVVTQTVVSAPRAVDPEMALAKAKDAYVGDRLASLTGYPARFCNGAVNLRLGLGMSEDQIAAVMKTIHSEAVTDSEYDVSGAQTAADLIRWVQNPPSSWNPLSSTTRTTVPVGGNTAVKADTRKSDPFVVTGVSLGLPGEKVFTEDNFEKLIRGETCIREVSDEYKQRLLDKNITRLIKGRDGSVNMDQATEFGDIPQLAGTMGAFDLAEEFGVDPKVIMAWDISTQLALAAGLLALRDAAIPLTPEEQVGKGGLRLIRSWQIPNHQRDRTGVIFASCFPGLSKAFDHAKVNGDDGEGKFDRRFLFQVLNMGHSQFAQHVGIRGPNTTVNVACASSTNAFSIAEDWLENDRADRVVIISADNVTGDSLWEWIGSGFAASGAASTSDKVEEAALPFDARRDGLVLGMGAASFVIERNSEAQARGVQPYAEILGTKLANSAFHGTRLDVEHVASTFDGFISEIEDKWGLDRHKIAAETVFFSHETYTPARGGSAQAEVKALRDTFGKSADSLIISNTKGFTGHPMGVGIEDASMIYGLHHGKIPPIANHKVVDEELGNLNLSKGGSYPNLKYGIRFGAGFGSQIALSLLRKWPVVGERIDAKKFLAWNQELAGTSDVRMRILQNKLVAYVNGDENLHGGVEGDVWELTAGIEGTDLRNVASTPEAPKPVQTQAPAPTKQPSKPVETKPEPAPAAATSAPVVAADSDEIRKVVLEVVVEHTGYPADFVEFDQDLEGELGIDTVKQAEIMADIRGKFNLPVDEDFILADYPTLEHMMGYIVKMQGGESVAAPAPAAAPVAEQTAVQTQAPVASAPEASAQVNEKPAPAPVAAGSDEIRSTVLQVVVEHTGYPEDFIEFDQDLEGELGIDTVKQAEIMGDIRAKFSLPIDEDFILADYPTLDHMMGYIVKMQGGEVAPKSTAVEPTAPMPLVSPAPVVDSPTAESSPSPAPTPGAGSEEIQSAVVSIVVKHTGYPEDFIEMDQDLEGELGIDTVKQAEIMGDVREHFSLPLDEDFVLADHPTLNHFVAYISNMKGGNEASPAIEEESPTETASSSASDDSMSIDECRRWQVEVEQSLGEDSPLNLTSGTVVVSIDDWGVSEELVSQIKQRGLNVVKVGFEQGIRGTSTQEENGVTVFRADPGKPEHIAEICEQMQDMDVVGIIHLSALKLAGADWHAESAPSSQIALSAHGWFGLLKGLDAKMAKAENGFVVSVTSMDGRHGNLSSKFNSLQCAASGVTKSYGGERPDLRVRAFDVHPDLILDAENIAQTILDDVMSLGGDMEIGLDRDGTRWTLVCFAEDLVEEIKPLQSDDVWLVSGGGSGITAASIIGVAQASKNAGANFVLLGRTSLIPATKDWIGWSEEEIQAEKMALRERMMEASSTGKVTMVDWNKAFDKMLRSRDVYQTISEIESTGNKAEYHSADVTDVEKLEKIGGDLGSQITGLVHGAGMEDSKLVADKKNEIFDLTIRIKVDGWKAMLAAVRASGDEELRFAACFTSVAGRFGNIGQTDYAAANSVLDAEMARLTASGKTRGVAIGWTGWQDVGMATRGSIQAVFDASGIMTIPKDLGVEIFVKEALAGGKRRVIGCGSLGIMDKFNSFREAPLKLPAEMSAVIANPSRFPFIDKVVELDAGKSLTSQSMLSAKLHPFLVDHSIDGVPYHPGVMALEMFAQNALLLRPDCAFAGFENVKFGLPVKLMKSEMITRVKVEVSSDKSGIVLVQAKLVSDLMNSKGQVFGEREHHEATVRLVEKSEDLTKFFESEISHMPSIGTPADGELIHSPSFIYLRYFHGPRFQSHGGVLRGVGTEDAPGVDGIALMRHQLPATDQFEMETNGEEVLLEALPMLIEAGFQNAGLVAMETEGFSSLPVGIEWSSSLRVPETDEKLRLRSVKTATEDAGVTVHDVVIVGDDDAPVLSLKGLRLKAMAPVDSDQAFKLDRD